MIISNFTNVLFSIGVVSINILAIRKLPTLQQKRENKIKSFG